ncbi:Uncharacterised protein [Achromobacter xylosoxidans]|nr:Uncharacterised protein [Achromobacter xylosoxidans]
MPPAALVNRSLPTGPPVPIEPPLCRAWKSARLSMSRQPSVPVSNRFWSGPAVLAITAPSSWV